MIPVPTMLAPVVLVRIPTGPFDRQHGSAPAALYRHHPGGQQLLQAQALRWWW